MRLRRAIDNETLGALERLLRVGRVRSVLVIWCIRARAWNLTREARGTINCCAPTE